MAMPGERSPPPGPAPDGAVRRRRHRGPRTARARQRGCPLPTPALARRASSLGSANGGDQASKALDALKADEGTAPVNAADLVADRLIPAASAGSRESARDLEDGPEFDDDGTLRLDSAQGLPTLRVLPAGDQPQAPRAGDPDLQLPVVVAVDVDEADVVMTVRTSTDRRRPSLREAEERALPIYVLKSNTIQQMQSLADIDLLARDWIRARPPCGRPRKPSAWSCSSPSRWSCRPQNAYIRRLQHQMAERANLVSRSRGREPYRRVRLYPDAAKSAWR